jgi:predicted RNA binding protein YcfA (HicA-like mRNA interferase family)
MKYNFIKTSDKETINTLLAEGFKLVSQDGNVATFLNDHSLTFDNTNKKFQYSNMLTF